MKGRTDMAEEAHAGLKAGLKRSGGIESELIERDGIKISRIRVVTKEGAEAIGKPQGTYITLSVGKEWQGDENGITSAASVLGGYLRGLLPEKGTVLVAGLGNRQITPDSLGPLAVERIIVTRHLLDNGAIRGTRAVCAVSAGVLGCTGVETAEIVRGICSRVQPSAVIAIDSLASLSTERLCRSFQLSDTGIVPGAGACNARRALNRSTLGIPVIALGVPTVVDAETIVTEALGRAESEIHLSPYRGFLVTPKDIDALIRKSARVLAYAVNRALLGDLSVAEMEQLLS